jgi:hypothetical protein
MMRFLAHAQGQQALAQGVVDLVGAGVVEVFALQPDAGATFGTAVVLAKPFGLVERTGPAHIGAQQVVEATGESRIGPGLGSGHLKLGQGRHQGFGHVLAAVGAKTAQGVGTNRHLEGCRIGERGASAGSCARLGEGAGHRRRGKHDGCSVGSGAGQRPGTPPRPPGVRE